MVWPDPAGAAEMSDVILLEPRLDYQAVAPLLERLRAAGPAPLTLDAREVGHVGALALQVILSAVKTRAAAGQETRLANPPDACIDQLALFGFSPETLSRPETWT